MYFRRAQGNPFGVSLAPPKGGEQNSLRIVLSEQKTGKHGNRILIKRLSKVGRQFVC
jgi:hypothetical protein